MSKIEQNIMHEKLRKTKLCSFFQEGKCLRGKDCTYAHSEAEQSCQPDLSKTLICLLWKAGKCKHSAEKCRFAHGKRYLRVAPESTVAPEPQAMTDDSFSVAQLDKVPVKIQLSELSSLLASMASEQHVEEVNISMAPLTILTEGMDSTKPPFTSTPCSSRPPTIGDRVQSLVGEVTLEDVYGRHGAWKLAPDEFAVVSAVDEDGDFRLRNVHGLESCFSYRKDYAYVSEAARVPGHDEIKALAPWWRRTSSSSAGSTEPGDASDDDCSSFRSPSPVLISPRPLSPPPGLCLANEEAW